ncbi:SgcJ/EcaC family oxidoreductase [Pseudoxanthomonas japonensis]|uniref:DUF4440 domain-containing protein n=1 Tax=Pseudoxanthomonas japonensis TaxID=69284 RepID=A0ABQ6ZCK3_9GAMM|nr:SgcJ/EcaC family oxidoreductase [Pseudoxanthomonas japonensis]KAF1721423.1 hypothetical protein CSC78_18110 [Pseudoxanthomonas japonensis]
MKTFALFTLLAASIAAAQAEDRVAAGPESLSDGFVAAWNSHDAKEFEQLFTTDAYWVPTVDSRLDGRAAVVADLDRAHRSWARHTTLAIDRVSVTSREIAPGVAVVLFHAPFRQTDGTLTSPGNAVMLVAVKEDSTWRIASGQITKPGETVTPR